MIYQKEKRRGFVPCVRLIENLRIKKQSVLLMIGNVVSAPVIIVTVHFNCIKQFIEPSTKVQEWFKTRGISKNTLNEIKVSEGPEYMPQTGKLENAIHFNYYIGDTLVNIKYRDGRKNFKLYKGAEKVFYNINSIVGFEYCVIVEGEMDVLSFHEAGITNVISVPNGATLNSNNLDYLDNCIDYFNDKEKIIIAVDQDDAGQALQQELIRRLGAEVCYIAAFDDCKDANEYLLKHGKQKALLRGHSKHLL